MHVLFIHQAFPAQFGRLALELTRRYGWRCTCLVDSLSSCPTPSPEMLEHVSIRRITLPANYRKQQIVPWPQSYGEYLLLARAVFEGVGAMEDRPDLVVGHGGLGPTMFLPEVLDCPILNYCEYYFAPRRRDLTYRLDLPPAEPAPFYPRCINASTLTSLVAADGAYAPTAWQRDSFPQRFHHKIEVHFDGIDTGLHSPGAAKPEIAGHRIDKLTRVVTYIARGLESMRGFDLFMRIASRIARERSDVLFIVVGAEESYYGWDRLHIGRSDFKTWVLEQVEHDSSRFLFLGHIDPSAVVEVLRRSDLHLYLTVPFVASWSLFGALACGRVVLASDVAPVREIIEPGKTGLVEPLFDVDRMVATALHVLDDPAQHAPLGAAASELIKQRYSLEVTVPALAEFFERRANRVVSS